jgi:hypothetical protein
MSNAISAVFLNVLKLSASSERNSYFKIYKNVAKTEGKTFTMSIEKGITRSGQEIIEHNVDVRVVFDIGVDHAFQAHRDSHATVYVTLQR